MLSMKKIDTIRWYKFDLDMPVRAICYKLDVSPTTVYKYTRMDDFTELLRKPRKSRPSKMEPYKQIIKEWLLEDKTRHYKQRHTAKHVFDRLSEMYPDFNLSYATVQQFFMIDIKQYTDIAYKVVSVLFLIVYETVKSDLSKNL